MTIFDTGTLNHEKPAHHMRWFLIGGFSGLAIAIFCATNMGQHFLSENLLLSLWPMGIVLMATNEGTWGIILFAIAVAYGGNFMLYGLAALLISLTYGFCRSLVSDN